MYAWCLERIKPDDMDQWHNDLADLLPWQGVDSQAAVDLESESFMAMMQGNKGG